MTSTPLSGFARVAIVILTFAAGCAASVGLWIVWADRCNESCPANDVIHMMVFLALLPSLSSLVAVLVVATRWPARAKQALAVAALAVAIGVGIWVGHVGGASATVSGLR